ncbi:phosphate transport system substrate-binding protein, partial [Haematococcus lacustris]
VLVGSISVFHSLPGVAAAAGGLQLSPCTLSAIFQGRLTQWDDPRIAAENPRLVEGGLLPAGQAIRVVRRADGSSSTYALSTYLAK